MEVVNIHDSRDESFIRAVEEESEQNVSLCYQCGNCTAGCPYTFVYDIPVSQVMRYLQAGQKETLLSCHSVWLCGSCQSCTTRCPNDIDVARIMDVLRHMARREGFYAEKNVKAFWDTFLESVRKHGRVFEMGLLAGYVAKTGRFWDDADLGPKILPKGKLSFSPHDIQGKEEVEKIFTRFYEKEKARREAAKQEARS